MTTALPNKLYFRIGEVAGIVGVEPHVLRYWEREFRSNIRPGKSARGQRVYSRRDVENLLRVRELLYTQGFTIAGARKQLQHGPKAAPPEAKTEGGVGGPPPPPPPDTPRDPLPAEPPADESLRETLTAVRDEVAVFLDELGVKLALRVVGVEGEPGVGPPDLSQSPSLVVEQWQSHRTGSQSVAWSCIAGDTGAWSPDATDLAQQKLAEIASATAERIRGAPTPMHVVETRADGRERTLSADDADAHATARTMLAFTEGKAHGCFVTCVGDCGYTVASATLEGEVRAPPSPGVILGSVGWMVHHPRQAEAVCGALLLGTAALAIWTRPRR